MEVKNESPSNPLLHAYPKQLESSNQKTAVVCDTNNAPLEISQQNKMNEETADFFSSLCKLTSLPHHSSFHGHPKKSQQSKIEEIPNVVSSKQIPSNVSSGIFSGGAATNSKLEVVSSSSSDLLFIPNRNNVNEKEKANDGDYDDDGLETIELINETKKSLLVDVSFTFLFD